MIRSVLDGTVDQESVAGYQLMKLLCSLSLLVGFLASPAMAETRSPLLDDKVAFIDDLMQRMTLDEKIGQLRLISIGGDMPKPRMIEEIAAGRVGATFNSVTRSENRPLQEAAVRNSRLKIPIFFAYDVIHGHRTTFPI